MHGARAWASSTCIYPDELGSNQSPATLTDRALTLPALLQQMAVSIHADNAMWRRAAVGGFALTQ
eukprot:362340-Chlamydomonas_euryale.AAC.3